MPSKAVETAVPAKSATRYIHALPTTMNTKIPPWGAMSVHWNAMEIAPATADPAMQAGSTCSGSEAA